jgi:hypothetical protein
LERNRRTCFTPLKVRNMKRSKSNVPHREEGHKSVKGRMVYNRKPTREWLSQEDAASPTRALESIMNTGVIIAKEKRDIMACDIPNASIQVFLSKRKPTEDTVVMKITGVLLLTC